MKVLGLTRAEWRQWREVLRVESRTLTLTDYAYMAWMGLTLLFVHDPELEKERLATCAECPIFNPELNQCRKITGGKVYGCGCWVKLTAKIPSYKCWARVHAPEADIGWKK